MDPLFVVFGLGVGVLVGLTGIGGGALMTPLLVLVGGVPPTTAIGTDVAYGALTKTVGGATHLRQGTVDKRVCLWLACGSVPGGLVGAVLAASVGERMDGALLIGIGVAVVLVALVVLMRSAVPLRDADAAAPLDARRKRIAVGSGLVLGAIVGLTSVGSGALIALVLLLVFRLAPHRLVGTDVAHAAILLWTAGLAHLAGGTVDLLLVATLLVGSIPGVWLGTKLMPRVPAEALRVALGCVLLASGLAVLDKAGAPLPSAAILVAPALAALVVLAVRRQVPSPDPVPA